MNFIAAGVNSAAVCFGLIGLMGTACAKPPVVIGVVEAQPDVDATADAPAHDQLRVAFRYQDGRWRAVCEGKLSGRRNDGCALTQPADPRTWRVIFDGQDLGNLSTAGWRSSDYSAYTGALNITTSPVPGVHDPATAFAAWWVR